MNHTLRIDLIETLDEELNGILAEIEGFIAAKRTQPKRIPPMHVAIDVPELLAKSKSVALIWTVEDVHAQRPGLTDEQAWQVLRHAEEHIERDIGLKTHYLREYALQFFGTPREMTYAVAMALHAVCRFSAPDAKFDYHCFLTDGRCVLLHSVMNTHSVIVSTLTSDDLPYVIPLDQVPSSVYGLLDIVIAA